jgi:hypothetical protein
MQKPEKISWKDTNLALSKYPKKEDITLLLLSVI